MRLHPHFFALAEIVVFTICAALSSATPAPAAEIPLAQRQSAYVAMSPQTRAMQDDDTANPGMFWVLDGEALWSRAAGDAQKSCGDCHGDAKVSMRGVTARYPAYDVAREKAVDIEQRVNLCRVENQKAPALAFESKELLALTAYLARQSKDTEIAPPQDARTLEVIQRGRDLFSRRQGQLNLSCAICHDDNWGGKLAGALIPQAHPTSYPVYRLEWQTMGSLQRRLRNCLSGMRAQAPPPGSEDLVALEAFLMQRARGMRHEGPGVRP